MLAEGHRIEIPFVGKQVLMLGFKLIAGALASLAFVGVAIGAGLI